MTRKETSLFSLPLPVLSQVMTDVVGNSEEERRAEFYFQPWAQEAVCRYFYSKVGTWGAEGRPTKGKGSAPGGAQ